MTEYRDEGLNDTCLMSLTTAAQSLASSQEDQPQHQRHKPPHQTTAVLSPPLTTVSTTCTTTVGSSTEISIRVENRTAASHTTTLCVEVSEGNSSQQISVSACTSNTLGASKSNISVCTIKDSLGRPHFKVAHTGPTIVYAYALQDFIAPHVRCIFMILNRLLRLLSVKVKQL